MRKKRKIERSLPNTDTLELNMKQVIDRGVFPLVTAAANSIHRKEETGELNKILQEREERVLLHSLGLEGDSLQELREEFKKVYGHIYIP